MQPPNFAQGSMFGPSSNTPTNHFQQTIQFVVISKLAPTSATQMQATVLRISHLPMIPTSQNSGYTQGRATQTASHPIPPNHIDLSEDPDSPDDNPTAGYYIQPNYPSVEYIDNLLLDQNLSSGSHSVLSVGPPPTTHHKPLDAAHTARHLAPVNQIFEIPLNSSSYSTQLPLSHKPRPPRGCLPQQQLVAQINPLASFKPFPPVNKLSQSPLVAKPNSRSKSNLSHLSSAPTTTQRCPPTPTQTSKEPNPNIPDVPVPKISADGSHTNSPTNKDTPKREKQAQKRARLDPEIVNSLKDLDLDQLRKKVLTHSKYKRLVEDDRIALSAAFHEYQKAIHRIAVEQLLCLSPVLKYVGSKNQFKGSTNYNNFCEYDVEARKAYYNYEITLSEQKTTCGALWKKVDEETKEKYKDPEFLATLPNPFGRDKETGAPPETKQGKENLQQLRSPETERWSSKVILDLKNLGAAHGVEGILMVVKPGASGKPPTLISGGSHLGVQFLNMFCKEMDPCASFFSFVSGQEVIRKASDNMPVVIPSRKRRDGKKDMPDCKHDLGSKEANYQAVKNKLNALIANATQNRVQAWPGKTAAGLKRHDLTL
ncbi:hypothetical protein PTTG_29064 [Puccinia triticina 1-1 BBBD Race 1]|uniref:Uncharacterized protein n=1 Tax=Puccinia triticina (isolate 1-1 / race 1 (BBBD)) TaxID=630390 RepID=A0A180G6K6_PUCT1|nr:hypothetical protein PTTG_29064 [Puccinia triticina 1-1 BBBD Race 1]